MKKIQFKSSLIIFALLLIVFADSLAQIPTGYYDDANNKTSYTLKTALFNIINDHNSKSYTALWTLYVTSDDKTNGKVWDMYSDVPDGTPSYEYTFVTNQCGNYSGEGSCYNREHSFPKSWFNDASPMTTDPFHIVPTDGYVNGKRGNYPFGEVGSASWTSTNGSKVGASNYPGYSGTVFEPIDEYKGDFARGYFYMATRYENVIAGWENNNSNGDAMLDGTSDQVYEDWALAMLIEWHNNDPVSQKEIDRNNVIYDYQNNRNPFIDHPEYVASVWGGGASDYYDDAQNKTGEQLKEALNNIISGHQQFPYTSSSTDTWDILKEADRDPSNSNNVIGIYSGFSMDGPAEYASGQGWTREHVWAKSRGDFGTSNGAGTDCHHLRAEDASTNSARSNRNFGECTDVYTDQAGTYNGVTESFTSSTEFVWKPRAEVKGDVARMLFYMATRYEGENGDPDLELTETLQDTESVEPLHAQLSVLLTWHQEDPVSAEEQARNEIIYSYQGNRNPFIDHPEYVASIWDGSTTPSISVSSSLTDFGEVNLGEVSGTQSYDVSGTDLTSDINIGSNNGFEVSLTDADAEFTSALTLSHTAGAVANTIIYVRFRPTTDSNSVINGTLTHASDGATTQTIQLSGTEKDADSPLISLSASLTDFGEVNFGEVSVTQSYSITGENLTNDISINSTSEFEISLTTNDQDFTHILSLTPSGGQVAVTTVFVRFKPISDSNATVTGSITHASTGAASQELSVSGIEYFKVIPEINFSFSLRNINPIAEYEIQLYADIAPNDNMTVRIAKSSSVNLTYNENYSTSPDMINDIIEVEWLGGELSASLIVNFSLDLLDKLNPGNLTFSLVQSDDYIIGANSGFVLNLIGDDVLNVDYDRWAVGVKMYPNPASKSLHIECKQTLFSYMILDLSGNVVKKGKEYGSTDLDISNLMTGHYIVQLISNEGVATKKFWCN